MAKKFRICYDSMSERYARELGYLFSSSFEGIDSAGRYYAVVMVLP